MLGAGTVMQVLLHCTDDVSDSFEVHAKVCH
jgi:hypothetical protein